MVWGWPGSSRKGGDALDSRVTIRSTGPCRTVPRISHNDDDTFVVIVSLAVNRPPRAVAAWIASSMSSTVTSRWMRTFPFLAPKPVGIPAAARHRHGGRGIPSRPATGQPRGQQSAPEPRHTLCIKAVDGHTGPHVGHVPKLHMNHSWPSAFPSGSRPEHGNCIGHAPCCLCSCGQDQDSTATAQRTGRVLDATLHRAAYAKGE